MGQDINQDTLDLIKGLQEEIKKADTYTTSTGLVSYPLEAPAKNLYAVNAPILKETMRVQSRGGNAIHWRAINSITGSGYDAMGWVAEGTRADAMTVSETDYSRQFVTLGEETAVSFEADVAATDFEDLRSTAALRLLQKLKLKEENAIIGGNAGLALGVCPTPATPTTATTGGTIAAAIYDVICVALTFEGFRNSTVAGGVATSKTITGRDTKTYTLAGGSSNKSAASATVTTSGATSTITTSVAVVNGAVGYAWYLGVAAGEKLAAITTTNQVTFLALPATGNQAATAITADNSTNTLAFDGLLTTAFNTASSYVKALANGATLTTSNNGSVTEIDTMLQSMWDNYQVAPEVLWVNSQQYKDIRNKIVTSGGSALIRYDGMGPVVDANVGIGKYRNFFTTLPSGFEMQVRVHPAIPNGTMLAYTYKLPEQYESNNVPRTWDMHVRSEYRQIEWPIRTRSYETGVYVQEVLACYAPFALGVITNITAG